MDLSHRVYGPALAHTKRTLRAQLNNFADGQFVAEYDGKIVGHCATFVIAEKTALKPHTWDEISTAGIERVNSRYTWKLYAHRMMTLARIYGFWKYVTNLEQAEKRRYLETLYALQFRPRAATIES